MPIEMPKGIPFSVDTWTPNSKRKRYHFLTHAHKDHCVGISHHSSFPIYSTHLTKTLLLHQFPHIDDSLFIEIEVGQSVVIDDPDGAFSVSAFDANHCPGDCRLTADCLQNLPMKYISKKGRETKGSLDYLFLDCTFASCSLHFPSNYSAIRQVINCIWKHPNAPVVYLACDLLGQEDILVEISRTFGSKIYVDETKNAECFHALTLTAPHILSPDASSRFQIFEGFPKLYERAEAKFKEAWSNLQPEPLFIRPSVQWYACEEPSDTEKQSKMRFKGAERDKFGVWHVCYSMHSSKEELEWALQLLQPKRVISTTPPCRAMELDYVRNHCFNNEVTADDPIWKLLNINTKESSLSRASAISDVSLNVIATSSKVGSTPCSAECNQSPPAKSTNNVRLCLNLSPVSNRRPITLFGRARLGLQDFNMLQEGKNSGSIDTYLSQIATNKTVEELSSVKEDTVTELQFEKSRDITSLGRANPGPQDFNPLHEENRTVSDISWAVSNKTVEGLSSSQKESSTEALYEESKDGREMGVVKSTSGMVSSWSFNSSLRKLYRMMNVPVPRPLPSLVELMGPSKRAKISSMKERELQL
ncbi:uncharacterized protein LOC131242614 isoform X2 [Magnolia sinica]|uniref:uncharacterized protein LOC131242614 isoform X2 n=1 Tax=Magnolia sinica TaxID=86752 RepID=UPI00265AE832|nr:uncharacterized protein LOC131242614 isoform X2 [Magnolia sinica]